jgi:hypothetical protein
MKNVFNPENIQPGDAVILAEDEKKKNPKKMIVQYVGGTYKNKIYCKELGREFYASCFKKVNK